MIKAENAEKFKVRVLYNASFQFTVYGMIRSCFLFVENTKASELATV